MMGPVVNSAMRSCMHAGVAFHFQFHGLLQLQLQFQYEYILSFQLAARMEHEQAIAKCQTEDPGGLSTANAWVVSGTPRAVVR